jgi:diguanylate cyclase (GGDEF)-like protein
MNDTAPETLTVLPNRRMFYAARRMQYGFLSIVAVAFVAGILPLFGLHLGSASAVSAGGDLPILLASLLCGLSLFLSGPERGDFAAKLARRAAKLLAICEGALLLMWLRSASAVSIEHGGFSRASIALGFGMLVIVVLLIDHDGEQMRFAVDVLVCCLCALSLVLIANAVLGRLVLFGSAAGREEPGAVLVCLVALSMVVALRQAERGVLQIFLGAGMGSGLARIYAPIVLLAPFAGEMVNALVSRSGLLGHVSTAVIASAGSIFAVGVLLFFTWRISRMENEIHDLILRDEATRLYNQRGFQMLAEHALRLAQRSRIPFSVLFINFENLAEIHEQLGPKAAAASLAEAGMILRSTFRESDIKGRIGAGEFAVAGQFDRAGISIAALRLEAAVAARSSKWAGPAELKFSMGHVTTIDPQARETLKGLLARAGQMRNRMDTQLKETLVN